ncbi:MAG: histidine kinase [Bacteroidetes bacterium]|nr:histidine kinase [Bacteroidota bacterium]
MLYIARFFICFQLLVVNVKPLLAQRQSYTLIKRYTVGDFLPQNIITGMAEDSSGNLILINGFKLVLFDGFRSFIWKPPENADKKYQAFVGLGKTKAGITYALCEAAQLSNIYQLKNGIDELEPLSSGVIPICASIQSPRSLLTSPAFFTRITTTLFRGKLPVNTNGYINPEILRNIFFVVNEDFAFALQQRIVYRINSKTETIEAIQLPAGNWQAFLLSNSLILINDKRQCYLLDNLTKGIGMITATHLPVAALLQSAKRAYSFSDENNDFIVIENAVYRVNEYNGKAIFELLLQLPPDVFITSVRFNKDASILFVATLNAGLFIATKSVFSTYSFPHNNISTNIFYSHLRLKNGNILTTDGLFIPEGNSFQNKRFTTFVTANSFYKNESGFVFTLQDDTLSKWTADVSARLKVIEFKGGGGYSFVRYKNDCLAFIARDTSIMILDDKDSLFQFSALTRYGAFISLSVSNEKIWIGTDSGLVSAQLVGGGLHYKLVHSIRKIKTIYADKNNVVWIGVRGQGIVRYDPSGKVTAIPVDKRKSLYDVHNFYEDNFGFFWLPTNNGLIQVLKKDLDEYVPGNVVFYYRHSISTGLPESEFNSSSNPYINLSAEGELTFPSMRGLISFYPGKIKAPSPLYPLRVKECTVDGNAVDVNHLILPYNFSKLSFAFTSPYFGAPENLLVDYRIPELDTSWQSLDLSSNLDINRLPFGTYTIELRKYNGFNDSKYDLLSIRVVVRKPWYLQSWFLLILIFLVSLIIYLVTLWWYNQKLEKSKLNNLIIESELKRIRTQINPHFIQNTFNTLAFQLRLNGVEKAVDSIRHVSAYILNVLENSDQTISSLEDVLIDTENYLQMQQFVHPDHFTYLIHVDDNVDTIGVFLPAMLLQPIVENSIKHGFKNITYSGFILVKVSQQEAKLEIEVLDNGSGILNDKVNRSFGLELTQKMLYFYKIKSKASSVKISLENRKDGISGVSCKIILPLFVKS